MSELHELTARAAVDLLRTRQVTPLEMVDAAARRIEETDREVNALPTLCLDRARDHARRLMASGSPQEEASPWLGGLPIAVKDLVEVAGVRTTWGSPIFADHIPERSDILVETLERKGAIVIAKSNTPELGHGGTTFNEVFGHTRNPWKTSKTCGGSSGGSAVALATGQVWLATGSDMGCSLRLPAAFCSVVALRPTPGRVARGPKKLAWGTLSVEGPMGRTVGDVALMFDAQVGTHPRDPLSMPALREPFLEAVDNPKAPKRVAFSRDLGGITPVAKEVGDICAAAAARFGELGANVEESCPDLSDAREIFHVLRSHSFVINLAPLLEKHRDKIKPEVVWNIEEGMKVTADEIGCAERKRSDLYHRVAEFFETYDMLICPASCAPPFDVNMRALTALEGYTFANYYDWYTICFAITLTSCPAMSIPCGFTTDGLPVGMQLVAPHNEEASLFSAAALFEEMAEIAGELPIEPRGGTA